MSIQTKPNRILRWPEVQARVGLSRSYTYTLQQKGLFPLPFKLVEGGRASGYLESEIDSYIENRFNSSRT